MRRFRLGARAAPAIALGLLVALSSATAQAAWVSGFEGDHDVFTGTVAGTNGIVNFAVWEGSLSDLVGDPAVPVPLDVDGAAVDPDDVAGAFTYLYQVVNTGANGLWRFEIIVPGSLVNAIGYFATTVFNEPGEGATGPSGNQELNNDLDPNDPFVSDGGTTPPSGGSINGDAVKYDFGTPAVGGLIGPLLATDDYSPVLWLTSDQAPTFVDAKLYDTGSADGRVPAPTPVPATLALLLSGLPGFAGLGLVLQRRRRETAQALA